MFSLLKEIKFGPFFWTMGLGAFNDNMFKSALAILIAYNITPATKADILVQASAGLFILPFFIFSGISGQICDKYEKSWLVRWIKVLEIMIMAAAALGFFLNNIYFLMLMLFLMGTQSTLFGPVKYSILPQHLNEEELLPGNSLISSGTHISILLGTILGGILVSSEMVAKYSLIPIACAVVIAAVFGWVASRGVPEAPPSNPDMKIHWNPLVETIRTIRFSNTNKSLLFAITSISWFWLYGFIFISSVPSYCRDALAGNEQVATLLFTVVSIGLGIGSIICNKISRGKIELGLVPYAGIGLTIFALDIYFLGYTAPASLGAKQYLSPAAFFAVFSNVRASFDLFMIGMCGGMFIVPLYVLLQEKSPNEMRSRLIASNNIINAIFMVSAAILVIFLFKIGLNIVEVFLVVSILNFLVVGAIFKIIPEYFVRFTASIIVRVLYRYKVTGVDNFPQKGPFIIASNHVSFMDPLLIGAGIRRPPRFIMDKPYYDLWYAKWIFKAGRCIPITPAKVDPHALEKALQVVSRRLRDGDVVALFPEGWITSDGQVREFKDGVERISKSENVPVIPIAIRGMWGSWFSRKRGRALQGFPSRIFSSVEVVVGKPISPEEMSTRYLQDTIVAMRGDKL